MLTLVASALAGGDCIDDADVLRTGGTACTLGGTVKAPSTLGTFLRSFRWGHVRQLDRVSRELLARAWQAGAGPGDGPLIDLDSTICETYGLVRRAHATTAIPARGATTRCWPSPPAPDVLMSTAARGPGQHRPRRRPLPAGDGGTGRYAGANGRLTLRADSGFYTYGVVSVCRNSWMSASPSPSASTKACTISRGDTRRCLDADSLLDGRCRRCGRDHLHPLPGRGGRRAGTAHRPAGEADARLLRPLRQIQLSLASSPTGTGSCSNWRLTIAATPRSRMPYAPSTASG